jgi:hypothetical protein
MGAGCSTSAAAPIVEPTITTPTRSASATSRGSPKSARKFSSDPFEGGNRPIHNLDVSLRQLLRTNEGAPAFSTDTDRKTIAYRVKLHPPQFELQNSRGQQIVQLTRDTRKETPSLLVLTGKSMPKNDIWGGTQPACQYEVRIPASTLLADEDLDAGIAYRGQLIVGMPRDATGRTRTTTWLYR